MFCSVEGCERRLLAKGLCQAHYTRLRKFGDVQADKPVRTVERPLKSCSVTDCDRVAYTAGYCELHYRRLKRNGHTNLVREPGLKTCTVEGCNKVSEARGLCHGHYQRELRGSRLTDSDPLDRKKSDGTCSAEGCDRPRKGLGFCATHLARFQKYGDPCADRPVMDRRVAGPKRHLERCSVDGCDRPVVTNGLCQPHRARLKKFGDVRADQPIRVTIGRGTIHNGYRYVPVPRDERHLTNGRDSFPEHRLVMARHLGRALRTEESVHHINGDRLDNRLTNLEVWSRSQPEGARLEDKLRWAVEILDMYAPDLGRMMFSDTYFSAFSKRDA